MLVINLGAENIEIIKIDETPTSWSLHSIRETNNISQIFMLVKYKSNI